MHSSDGYDTLQTKHVTTNHFTNIQIWIDKSFEITILPPNPQTLKLMSSDYIWRINEMMWDGPMQITKCFHTQVSITTNCKVPHGDETKALSYVCYIYMYIYIHIFFYVELVTFECSMSRWKTLPQFCVVQATLLQMKILVQNLLVKIAYSISLRHVIILRWHAPMEMLNCVRQPCLWLTGEV